MFKITPINSLYKNLLFDRNILYKLENDFTFNNSNYRRKVFQENNNLSKQRIAQIITKTLSVSSTLINWEKQILEKEELYLFNSLIKNKQFYSENESIRLNIFSNNKECILLIFNKKKISYKSISCQKNKYIKLLISLNYHKYDENDFKNIEYLNNKFPEKYVQISSENLFKSRNLKLMSIKKYINFIGFHYIHPNKNNNEHIKIILNKYILKNTFKSIYIPTKSKDYKILKNYSHRNNKKIKTIVNELGYEYHLRDTYLRIFATFEKFSINKYIWIPPKGNFYYAVYNYSKKNKMNINDFIKELGFLPTYKLENFLDKTEYEYIKQINFFYNSLKEKYNFFYK